MYHASVHVPTARATCYSRSVPSPRARRGSLLAVLLAACGPSTLGPPRGPPCAPGTICTVAGTGEPGIGDDGLPAHRTPLYLPVDVEIGPDGRLYVVDFNNHRVLAVDEGSTARVVAGTGLVGDGPPGPAVESRLLHPTGVAFDAEGRMLIAAWHNYRVKRVDLATGLLEDVAGTGESGYRGDGGPALDATFDLPAGVVSDGADLLVADQGNQVVRRVRPDGSLERVAGRCVVDECEAGREIVQCPGSDRGYCGDAARCTAGCAPAFAGDGGDALEARFAFGGGASATPAGRIALAADGSIVVADTLSHRARRVDPSGTVTTVAGTGERGTSGDGGPATGARLDSPADVAVGPDGSVYVADTESSCIRRVDPEGTIETVAGRCGERGGSGDGDLATDALLDTPYGIAVDARGRLFIADSFNHRVRMIEPR